MPSRYAVNSLDNAPEAWERRRFLDAGVYVMLGCSGAERHVAHVS